MSKPRHAHRLAIIGLDGATFRVLDPLFEAGAMPALNKLARDGLRATLRSTIPAYTPPAWVSMATGVNPGRHGVFGFLAGTPQEPPQIAHSGLIDEASMWAHLGEIGVRTGVFNVPMTYPPTRVEGFMVSGGIAAGWQDPELPNFASDITIGRLINDVSGGPYPLDTVVSYERDWASSHTATRIEEVQRLRRKALAAVLNTIEIDVLFAVFEGVDRLQHLHYQYLVECSDWYSRPESARVRERAISYFSELDRAVEDIVAWAGVDGHVIAVSDHGFGPWEKTLNINLLLSDWGFLELPVVSSLTRLKPIAQKGQRLARQLLPRRVLHMAKAKVGRSIPWTRARAFASHVAEQGIHINQREDVPEGILDPIQSTAVETELIERLIDYKDPVDRASIVDRVIRRSEVIHGPHLHRSPHLFPICRDQRYELSDTLAATSPVTDHRDRPWGYHHLDGIFIAAGPDVAKGSYQRGLDIVDVLPTALHLAGLPIPDGLDGRVVTETLRGEAAARSIAVTETDVKHLRSEENPFNQEEEALIEQSLRGLGYID